MLNFYESAKNIFKYSFMMFILTLVFVLPLIAQEIQDKGKADTTTNVRFEHLALNVAEPLKAAKWYVDNLGLKIVRQGAAPTFTTFVADSNSKMMFEFFNSDANPFLDFSKLNYMSIHVAFSCDDISVMKKKLIAKGASVAEDFKKTGSGDQVLMLRDPWGLPIQFVQRVNPMLKHKGVFFEHIAFNLDDSRIKAKWLTDNLGMKVMRAGSAPNYGMFIADSGENMMLELYQDKAYPVIDFSEISHMSIHLAFMTYNIEVLKGKLLAAGANVVEDITKTPGGDFILMMRDSIGFPIQFVTRLEPMVK